MNFRGVSKQTWVRMIVLFLILLNQVSLTFLDFQLLPFNDDQLYEGVSTIFTIIGVIWAAWKNNSFTIEAQKADDHLERLKGGGR